MKHICCWSGGKDSTATVILDYLNEHLIDTIVMSVVMYDNKNNICGENPLFMDFVLNKAKPLFESWGYEVLLLRSDTDYLDIFNHIIEKPRKHMDHQGKKHGFPMSGTCAVKRECKEKPINDYLRSLNDEIIQYVGICADEPSRLESMHKDPSKISLLEKLGYTQKMAKELCYQYDLLNPTCEFSNRGGCWFCPNAKLKEHMDIKERMPEVWDSFISLEKEPNIAFDKWNPFGPTLEFRDMQIEDAKKYTQISLFEFI